MFQHLSLSPEINQASSFLESFELPSKLLAYAILTSQSLIGNGILQTRFYKLPIFFVT